jgi:hypothetical protein
MVDEVQEAVAVGHEEKPFLELQIGGEAERRAVCALMLR